MNGVTGSVLQVLRHLERSGHETLVIAPQAPSTPSDEADSAFGPEVDRALSRAQLLRSVPLPSYPQVRVVFARAARLRGILAEFAPDVVHLASPFVLGWQAVVAADALRIPTVAIYQTDVVAYAARYGVAQATTLAAAHTARLHRRATLTLAPSSASLAQLEQLGVDRVSLWRRGVDGDRFAPERRSAAWRERVAPGARIVGYVGRLAPEKQVDDLRVLHDLPGTRLVIVGDGPARVDLERLLPEAIFLGHLSGDELAMTVASFDVFVHPGESETFGQTLQEALASGVPVVATGRGGPVDIVRSSIDGWLYRPGDLADLRSRVEDLLGDETKRAAFGAAARAGMRERTWAGVCAELERHYERAIALRAVDDAGERPLGARVVGERPALPSSVDAPRWRRYVALGDSLTEGLCDGSRMPEGQWRGWADRLAELLATARPSHSGGEDFRYANLAVRSRRVRDLGGEQVPAALALRPDLVSIFMGSNDLMKVWADPIALAREVEVHVRRIRATGADVVLVTPFLPRRASIRGFERRFAVYAAQLRRIARETGSMIVDLAAHPAIRDLGMWADDRVHLRPRGHRFLAYRAAEVLGVPDAEHVGALDAALHSDDDAPVAGTWLMRDVLPWAWRRLRGRTAGDGLAAKDAGYREIRTAGRVTDTGPRPDRQRARYSDSGLPPVP